MATTAQTVFDTAMAMTDNMTDNDDYLARTIPIINNLSIELYPYSSLKTVVANTRPMPTLITLIADEIDLDDGVAMGVLPHGLAAQLLVDKNPTLSNYHSQRYEECLAKLRTTPTASEDITNLYGSIGLYEE